ncbi:TlpA disulfide reductase family protein [Croceicoccus ponticola]|uniref:TlpA family protein disulfide reductase n=1 Tax=Croceicoccus ponticola TaxID=2217664 RepID=UPI0026789A02
MPVIESRPSLRLAAIALICAVPAIAACDRQSESPAQPEASAPAAQGEPSGPATGTFDTSHAGNTIPDVAIALPDGTEKSLSSFKGKPLLVNLWATWCGPCVLEMPMLDALAVKHDGKLQVLTVSQDLKGAAVVEPWFAAKGFAKLQPWLDPDNDLTFALESGVLPTTVLYDADGKEVWRMIGDHDWSGPETDDMLAKVLSPGA